MIKYKKGQGISLNVIVVAAIALIVLVILIMIFTGKINLFGVGVSNATAGTGCQADYEQKLATECSALDTVYGNFNLPEGYVCCKKP